MRSKKHFRKNNKTLKNKINKYILKNDICCEDDVDRKIIIQDIFALYSEIASFMYEKDEYLSHIGNDLLKLIGYKIDLETKNDNEGVRLWNKINSKITLNKTSNKEKMIEVLNEVPLYYLLSFLGYAYYKYKINKDIFDNFEDK
jgi:hypothetical protein